MDLPCPSVPGAPCPRCRRARQGMSDMCPVTATSKTPVNAALLRSGAALRRFGHPHRESPQNAVQGRSKARAAYCGIQQAAPYSVFRRRPDTAPIVSCQKCDTVLQWTMLQVLHFLPIEIELEVFNLPGGFALVFCRIRGRFFLQFFMFFSPLCRVLPRCKLQRLFQTFAMQVGVQAA